VALHRIACRVRIEIISSRICGEWVKRNGGVCQNLLPCDTEFRETKLFQGLIPRRPVVGCDIECNSGRGGGSG
jgi:hypothetical protein